MSDAAGHTIVVPLDGSALSEQALERARTLAGLLQAPVELVLVLSEPGLRTASPSAILPERELAEGYLNGIRDRISDGSPVRVTVLIGPLAERLLRHLGRLSQPVVVMSTHGRGGLQRMMFGSVADKVVRSGVAPVVAIRPRETAATRAWQPRRLLVALDGSELGAQALPLATEIARRAGAELRLVRSVEPFRGSIFSGTEQGTYYLPPEQIEALIQESERGARAYLDTVRETLERQGIRVTTAVAVGPAETEVIRAAELLPADLIVMSTHGWGGLRRWALGSVTDEVSHRSEVPVLIVPARAEEPAPAK